jgi:DNA-binding NarL/FixJ family response regulator
VRISFEAPKPVVDYKKLMRELAVEAGIDWETVMSKDSHAPVVAVRRRCVAAMREHGLSVREIAEKLNLAAATVHYLMRHGGGL